jgi:hypothetical protein
MSLNTTVKPIFAYRYKEKENLSLQWKELCYSFTQSFTHPSVLKGLNSKRNYLFEM